MKKFLNSEFYKKYKKIIDKLFIIFVILISFFLIWTLFIKNIYTFKKMENSMQDAGKMYFERNLNKYPKSINGVSTVSLQKLYDRKLINALFVPGKKKFCSVDDSFVKVKKTKTGYVYYTYLKCDRYESNVDHEGPVIKLNGDDKITVEVGVKYQEQGVKSVVDDSDGSIKINKVNITGKVDTNTIGTYKVKYVVFDSLRNKTIKYRTVKVVKTLMSITDNDTKTGVYKGYEVNNYVLYSGMMWRIVKVNDNGTVKLITNDTLANISYSTGMKKDGYVYKWLNDYFYKKLYKPSKYIVDSSWCSDKTDDIKDGSNCKDSSINAKVGLITLQEYNQSALDDTYLNNGMTFWTMTSNSKKGVYANHKGYEIEINAKTDYNGVRPVINIKKGVSIISGKGTFDNPYVLEGYNYGKAGNKLNTRISGEYIKYSGYLWRIIDNDSSLGTKIVMDNVLADEDDNFLEISYGKSYDNNPKVFSIKNKDSIGYKLNKNLKDYLITKKMVKGSYSVDFYKDGIKEKNKSKEVKCLLSIPDITEIYSIGTAENITGAFYVRNVLDSKNKILVVNALYQTDEFYDFVFDMAGIKVVTYIDKDVLIKSGKGTYNVPYELR